jgi:hypothetical protein
MIKSLRRRLDNLERHLAPPRTFCVLGTPVNQQLVGEGLLPIGDLPDDLDKARSLCRRLTKSDTVVFLIEAEMGL